MLVISGFDPASYSFPALKFLDTFDRYWPTNISLAVYVEEPVDFPSSRIEFRPLSDCPGQMDFIREFGPIPQANGIISPLGDCVDSRFSAVKFSRQAFIPDHAIQQLPDGEIMVWLDSDVHTFRAIPPGFIAGLLGSADLAITGDRSPWGKATDIGFWAIRVSPATRRFVARLVEFYRSHEIFRLREWHSGFVFDIARAEFRREMVTRMLAPKQHKKCHIWFKTPLGQYMDHVAGRRKEVGRSVERPE